MFRIPLTVASAEDDRKYAPYLTGTLRLEGPFQSHEVNLDFLLDTGADSTILRKELLDADTRPPQSLLTKGEQQIARGIVNWWPIRFFEDRATLKVYAVEDGKAVPVVLPLPGLQVLPPYRITDETVPPEKRGRMTYEGDPESDPDIEHLGAPEDGLSLAEPLLGRDALAENHLSLSYDPQEGAHLEIPEAVRDTLVAEPAE